MRNKYFIGLLLSLLLGTIAVTPACSHTKTDKPQYSEGEAIALVKRNLSTLIEKSYIKMIPDLVDPSYAKAYHLDLKVAQDTQQMLNGYWTSSYLGNGKWSVFCDYKSHWYVYEETGTIEELPE